MNVYDFDNTIYKGDSTAHFYFFCLKRHPSMIKYIPSLAAGFAGYYIFKKGNKTHFKEKMYRFLKCIDLEKDVNDFWDKHISNVKGWYLKQQKPDDVIISASSVFLLTTICQKLGIKYLIASPVDKKTGKYNGLNCHGEEKVRRFYEEFPNGKIDEFYSDSKSDTPLALIAKKAYLVKGNIISDWK